MAISSRGTGLSGRLREGLQRTSGKMPPARASGAQRSATSTDRYESATNGLRTTAKWLIAAFASVGAVLVGGFQVAKIGTLAAAGWPWLVVGSAGLIITLVGVAYMIIQTARVFTDEWVSLASFNSDQVELSLLAIKPDRRRQEALRELEQKIEYNRQELFAEIAETLAGLNLALQSANQDVREARRPRRHAEAVARANAVRAAVEQVTDYANYERTAQIFRGLKARLAVAAVCVAVGVGLFASATADNGESEPVKVEMVRTG